MTNLELEEPTAAPGASDVPGRAGIRWDIAAGLLALAISGALLGVLPHLAGLIERGDPSYVADMDDILYLAWTREAVLHGTPYLIDAVRQPSGPMMHPWLLFVPPALLAHALGLDMTGAAMLWRGLAGALIALGLYFAIRPATRSPWVALGLAAVLTFNCGLISGNILHRQAQVILSVLRGQDTYFGLVPAIMGHLRVIGPALAIPFLLFHYGFVLQARTREGRWATMGAALSFGLLFYIYFYFWTAVLLGVAAALVLDTRGRKLYATVLVGGVLVGLPSIAHGAWIKASTPEDWLFRTHKFAPIGNTEILMIPKILIVGWLLVGILVFLRRRELIYHWSCVGAGLVCANHQLITGLNLENFHWSQFYGTTFSLLLVLVAVPYLFEPPAVELSRSDGRRRPWSGLVLPVLLIVTLPTGLWLRYLEATRTARTRTWTTLDARRSTVGFDLPAGAVVGGDGAYASIAAAKTEVFPLTGRLVYFSSLTTDEELDERLILNVFLLGVSREEALARLQGGTWEEWWHAYGPPTLDHGKRSLARRLEFVRPIWDEPRKALERYGVTHVVLAADAPTDHLSGIARKVHEGSGWQFWEILPPSTNPA